MCYERPKLKVIVVCLRFLAGIKDGERAVSLLLVISIENPNGVSFAPCGSHRSERTGGYRCGSRTLRIANGTAVVHGKNGIATCAYCDAVIAIDLNLFARLLHLREIGHDFRRR